MLIAASLLISPTIWLLALPRGWSHPTIHNLILPYDPDDLFRQKAFLTARKHQQGIYRDQPAVPSGPAYSNGVYVGPGYDFNDFNQVMAASWETPASQPLRNNSMVSVFHRTFRDNYSLILPFHTAKYFTQ